MMTRSPLVLAVVFLLTFMLVVPPDMLAQSAQRAGQVSREIPQVSLSRGSQTLPAPEKTLVDWGDVVNTGDGGRARVSLDDGSILNVGSSSHLTVIQHSAAAQQTQIELDYGRVRSQVVKQTKPNAKFEIHTAVGVAGVVGTDFVCVFLNGLFQCTVYEGVVKLCNLDPTPVCVNILAGQMSTLRDAHQSPDPPSQATPAELTDLGNATSVLPSGLGAQVIIHIPFWEKAAFFGFVAVPAIVIPVVTHGKHTPPFQPVPGNGCIPGGC